VEKALVPAVVYPVNRVNGYNAVRSLAAAGIPVIGLSADYTENLKSVYLCEAYVTPHAACETEAFIDFLINLMRGRDGKPVLFVMDDAYAFVVSVHQERLQPHFRYPYLDRSQLEAVIDKRVMHDTAMAAGMDLPETFFPEDLDWVMSNAGKLRYPVVIKPLVSRFAYEGEEIVQVSAFLQRYGKAVEAGSARELVMTLPGIVMEGFAVCVQERINCRIADLWTHNFYCDDGGEILAGFNGRKLHQQPADFGICTVGMAAQNPGVVEESKKFLQHVGYRGLGSMEYIKTGDGYKFVEINPRGEFWNGLAATCNVNLYKLAYDHLCGRPISPDDYRQSAVPKIWYDLSKFHKFVRYRERDITMSRFILVPKMEAIANFKDRGLMVGRIRTVAGMWLRLAFRKLRFAFRPTRVEVR